MKKDMKAIIEKLKAMHGKPRVELKYSNPLELIVSAILSAQCTDERVNKVTEHLFKRYTTVKDYADADEAELEEEIKPTGSYRNKAKSVKNVAHEIEKRFAGHIPEDIETMTTIKGIGRKTANMVLGLAFGKPSMIVETHVIRVSQRLGLTKEEEAEKVEEDLRELVQENQWTDFSLLMILHGRYICKARKPDCPKCLLKQDCNYYRTVIART